MMDTKPKVKKRKMVEPAERKYEPAERKDKKERNKKWMT